MQNVPITEAGKLPELPAPDVPKALQSFEAKLEALADRPQMPPVINIRTPEIKPTAAPVVNVTAEIKGGKVTKTVQRDKHGLVTGITEEEA